MELNKFTFYKVLSLPSELSKDTFYFVKPNNSKYVDYVITDSDGIPYDIINTKRITSLVLPYNINSVSVNRQILIFNNGSLKII
jgi:hypothetical protein